MRNHHVYLVLEHSIIPQHKLESYSRTLLLSSLPRGRAPLRAASSQPRAHEPHTQTRLQFPSRAPQALGGAAEPSRDLAVPSVRSAVASRAPARVPRTSGYQMIPVETCSSCPLFFTGVTCPANHSTYHLSFGFSVFLYLNLSATNLR